MVEYSKEQTGTIPDVVCPKCFNPLLKPNVVSQGTDPYERQLRTYYGWCFECQKGCLVIQFLRDGRWVIHKYRDAIQLEGGGQCKLGPNWRILEALPEAAHIVTGPGGEYCSHIDLNKINLDILGTLHEALKAVTGTVECLIRAIRKTNG